jgi:CRISPR-associated protein Cst2
VKGTPQPYKTQFMNTPLQGAFCLNYSRLGVFSNTGDKYELGPDMYRKYLDSGDIVEIAKPQYFDLEGKDGKNQGSIYEIKNNEQIRKDRASALLKSLAILRGGAKQAQFGTDVSPKLTITAGVTCGNMIFNSIFEDESFEPQRGKSAVLNIKTFKEIVEEYSDRIVTPIYIGIYMNGVFR